MKQAIDTPKAEQVYNSYRRRQSRVALAEGWQGATIKNLLSAAHNLQALRRNLTPAAGDSIAGTRPARPGIGRWLARYWKQTLMLLVVLALSAAVFAFRDRVAALGDYGYLGAFLIAMIGASSVVFPVPNWMLMASLGAALDPFMVGLTCAAGGTIGEMTGYALGYAGQTAVEKLPQYTRMVDWMKRRGGLTVFVLALLPNPLFDAAGAAAGALRFPVWKFVLFGFAGRLPKSLLYAYLGVWGLSLLHR